MKTQWTKDEIWLFISHLEDIKSRLNYQAERWKNHIPNLSAALRVEEAQISSLINIIEEDYVVKINEQYVMGFYPKNEQ
jgi:hypothetical protein